MRMTRLIYRWMVQQYIGRMIRGDSFGRTVNRTALQRCTGQFQHQQLVIKDAVWTLVDRKGFADSSLFLPTSEKIGVARSFLEDSDPRRPMITAAFMEPGCRQTAVSRTPCMSRVIPDTLLAQKSPSPSFRSERAT